MPGNEIVLDVQDINNFDDTIYEIVKGVHHAVNGYLGARLLGFTPFKGSIVSAGTASFWHQATGQSFTRTLGAWSALTILNTLHFVMPSLSPDKTFIPLFLLLTFGYIISGGFRHYINVHDPRQQPIVRQHL